MDYSLLALIGMIIVAMIISTRFHSRSWPGRPGWQYQRVFSVGFFGLLLFVSGLIGWDLRRSGGWFNGAEWAAAPIWSQAAIGAAMLLLAAFWARKVPPRFAVLLGDSRRRPRTASHPTKQQLLDDEARAKAVAPEP